MTPLRMHYMTLYQFLCVHVLLGSLGKAWETLEDAVLSSANTHHSISKRLPSSYPSTPPLGAIWSMYGHLVHAAIAAVVVAQTPPPTHSRFVEYYPYTTQDPPQCATKNLTSLLTPPEPTGALLEALQAHAISISSKCQATRIMGGPCTSLPRNSWCAVRRTFDNSLPVLIPLNGQMSSPHRISNPQFAA